MNRELFHIPNIISIIRILLIFPLVYFLSYSTQHSKTIVITILILMYISDLLDGYLARKLNQVTDIGKIIDPLADKIAVVAAVIVLFLQGRIEVWFFAVVVLRDLFIFIFGLYLRAKTNVVLMSNYPGKIAVLSIGITILFIIINDNNSELLKILIGYLYYISVILIVYSLILYLIRFYKTIGARKNG